MPTSKQIGAGPAGLNPAPASSVTGPDAYGAAAFVGTTQTYALGDHDHGLPAAPASGPLATVNEDELTVNTPVTVLTYTPGSGGNLFVSIYFRVAVAPTAITVEVTWTDAAGAHTFTPLSAVTEPVGSYTLASFMIATTASAVDVIVTAGTANQVYVSASIAQG